MDSKKLGGSSSGSCLRVETLNSEAPHNAVKAEGLSVFFGKLCLLRDTEVTIAEHTRQIEVRTEAGETKVVKSGLCYGLVGPNGSGKSTLLKLIAERGVPIPPCWDVCYVGQQLPDERGQTPVEEVLRGDAKYVELLDLCASLERTLADPSLIGDEAVAAASARLVEVHNELSRWDTDEREVENILLGLGFRREHEHVQSSGAFLCETSSPTLGTPTHRLSGGWRMRVQLARALWLQPSLLLLDEPTNHLDVHALIWLEDRLKEYPHTVVIVSHDVSFLHSACWEILWINEHSIESMPRDAITQEDLARMQRRRNLKFHFKAADDVDRHGLSFHNVTFDYSGVVTEKRSSPVTIHVPGSLRITGSSRVVLLGRNGSGKSTFLGLCTGSLKPLQGTVDCTQDLKVGHYSQATEALDNCDEPAAMFLVRDHRNALEARAGVRASDRRLLEEARAVLSPFGIENELAVGIPAMQLSGGQKVCVKFAVISLYPAHILLLDEPTNHLDAAGREALARGLIDFPGGVVIVTHDDYLIYRLIECNSAESELIVCDRGLVRKEREWASHRLHTVREDVRRAEEADGAAVVKQSAAARKSVRQRPSRLMVERKTMPTERLRVVKQIEPTTPPGFFRVSAKPKTMVSGLNACVPTNVFPLEPDSLQMAHANPELAAEPSHQEDVKDSSNLCVADISKCCIVSDQANEVSKRIRSLRKKLQQIEKLKASLSRLDANASAKVSSEQELLRELCALENGEEFERAPEEKLENATVGSSGACHELEVALDRSDSSSLDAVPAAFASNTNDGVVSEDYRLQCEQQHPSALEEKVEDLPDSWEELDSETEATETIRTREIHRRVCTSSEVREGSVASVETASVVSAETPSIASTDVSVTTDSVDGASMRQAFAETKPSVDTDMSKSHNEVGGRHSRFRKDLVNLNKAVAKWLKQEERGTITRDTVKKRILESPVAQHLRSSHGDGFEQNHFLSEVLARAQRQ
jgi:ATPase subunit of ABC transporter with duplicated ATPase domains